MCGSSRVLGVSYWHSFIREGFFAAREIGRNDWEGKRGSGLQLEF